MTGPPSDELPASLWTLQHAPALHTETLCASCDCMCVAGQRSSALSGDDRPAKRRAARIALDPSAYSGTAYRDFVRQLDAPQV